MKTTNMRTQNMLFGLAKYFSKLKKHLGQGLGIFLLLFVVSKAHAVFDVELDPPGVFTGTSFNVSWDFSTFNGGSNAFVRIQECFLTGQNPVEECRPVTIWDSNIDFWDWTFLGDVFIRQASWQVTRQQPGFYRYIVTPCTATWSSVSEYGVDVANMETCVADASAESSATEVVFNRAPEMVSYSGAQDGAIFALVATARDIDPKDPNDPNFPGGMVGQIEFGYQISNKNYAPGEMEAKGFGDHLEGPDADGLYSADYIFANLPAGITYTFAFRVLDNYFLWSDWSYMDPIEVSVDPNVPVLIMYPDDDLGFHFQESIKFSAAASLPANHNGSIHSVEFCRDLGVSNVNNEAGRADDGCFGLDSEGAGLYSVNKTWATIDTDFNSTSDDLFIDVYAIVEDSFGNKSTSANKNIKISTNFDPEISFQSPGAGSEHKQTIYIDDGVVLRVHATDSDPGDTITEVEFKVNGAPVKLISGPSENDLYEYIWFPLEGSAENQDITATAFDGNGGSHTVTVSITLESDYIGTPTLTVNDDETPEVNQSGEYTLVWEGAQNAATDKYELMDLVTNEVIVLDKGLSFKAFPNMATGVYQYKIRGCSNSADIGCGEYPNELLIQVERTIPTAPTGFKVTSEGSTSGVNYGDYSFSWDVNPADQAVTYQLEEKIGGLTAQNSNWTESYLGSNNSFAVAPNKAAGIYSYQVSACNSYGCAAGIQLTIQVSAPFLDAKLSCNEGCLNASGRALDTEGVVSVSPVTGGWQETYTGNQINWLENNENFSIDLSGTESSAALDSLGLAVTYTNPNGASYTFTVNRNNAQSYLDMIESAPIEYNNVIYVGIGDELHAIKQADGKEVNGWPFTLANGAISSTPAINAIDELILFGSADDSLWAVEQSGGKAWQFVTGGDLVSSPVLDVDVEGNVVAYVGSMDGNLYAVDAASGDAKWLYPAGAPIADSPVTAGGGWIYVTTQDGVIHAVGRDNLGPDVLVWESQDDSLLRDELDASNWQPLAWQEIEFIRVSRLFDLLLQPPLNFNYEIITYWTYAITQRIGIEEIADAFLGSDTGQGTLPASFSDSDFIDELYRRAFLGYEPSVDPEPVLTYGGLAHSKADLLAMLADGASRGTIAILVADSEEYRVNADLTLQNLFDYFYVQDFSWVPIPDDCAADQIDADGYTRDCDEDDLVDWWEVIYFGDLTAEEGAGDADGDGISNAVEYASAEDPCAASECIVVKEPPAPEVGIVPPANSGSESVGAVAGQFRVNEGGAATYSIPINVKPGVAGVTPSIGLSYSSQSGNGLLGLGWNIGGLSAISRCPQTKALDGAYRPIDFSREDRLCYNGQRLIAVEGDYGYAGTVYRTEIDSDVKITSIGSTAGSPDYFEMQAKDGSTTFFGLGNGSKDTLNNGTQTLSWGISKFEDNMGNPIAYNYLNDASGQRLDTILYAYSGTGYYSVIEFDYDLNPRSDVAVKYRFGETIVSDKRLAEIVISDNGNDLKTYKLNYFEDESISRLQTIEECAGDGSICLQPTTLEWSLPAEVMAQSYQGSNLEFGTDSLINGLSADINGDGHQDLIWMSIDIHEDDDPDFYLYWALWDSESGALRPSSNYAVRLDKDHASSWMVFDYNGDGLSDILFPSFGQWYVAESNGAGYSMQGEWESIFGIGTFADNSAFIDTGIPASNDEIHASLNDVNSDGLTDLLVRQSDNSVQAYFLSESLDEATLTRSFTVAGEVVIPAGLSDGELRIGDFNGDGLFDFIDEDEWKSNDVWHEILYARINNGDNTFRTEEIINIESAQYAATTLDFTGSKMLDVNGDGNTDIVVKHNSYWHVYLSDGKVFRDVDTFGVNAESGDLHFVDFNQDGYTDVILQNEQKLYTWVPEHEYFVDAGANDLYEDNSELSHLFLDVTGDGNGDLLRFEVRDAGTRDGDHVDTRLYVTNGEGKTANVITSIDNGLGNRTSITYSTLSNHIADNPETGVYRSDLGDVSNQAINTSWNLDAGEQTLGKTSGVMDVLSGAVVVSQVDKVIPVAGAAGPGYVDYATTTSQTYRYAGNKVEPSGRGGLGFRELETIDQQSGLKTTTTYRQDYPFVGMPLRTKIEALTDTGYVTISESASHYQFHDSDYLTQAKPYRVALGWSEEWSYDPNSGAVLSYVVTDNRNADGSHASDSEGNLLASEVLTYGDYSLGPFDLLSSVRTANEYNDSALGSQYSAEYARLSRSVVTHSRPGEADRVRDVEFNYYYSGDLKGLIKEEIELPGTAEELVTHYEYDAVGNIIKTTKTGAAGKDGSLIQSRSSRVEYDGYGRFVDRTYTQYDASGAEFLSSEVLNRNALGIVTKARDAAGIVVETGIDGFGRKYYETASSGGFSQTTSYLGAGASCPAHTQYYVESVASDGSESLTCIDSAGQAIRSGKIGFDGLNWYVKDTEYDHLGRVKHQSMPFEIPYNNNGSTYNWATYHYDDALGRLTKIVYPDLTYVSTEYDGFHVTTTNRLGQVNESQKNALGEISWVKDTLQGRIDNHYDAVGNLLDTTVSGPDQAIGVPSAITVQMSYDSQGQKIAMSDPDKGDWEYSYNAFGQLVEQRSANGHKTVISFDVLGRMLTRSDYRDIAGSDEESHSEWQYDTAWLTNEVGNNLGTAWGQLARVTHSNHIDGTSSEIVKAFAYDYLGRPYTVTTSLEGTDYVETTTYDELGRVFQQFDASGNSRGTESQYNDAGYLEAIVDAARVNGNQALYVNFTAMDAMGNVTQQMLGNSVVTTRYFNPVTGHLESIHSEGRNVLLTAQDLSYQFDVLGNLEQRTDILNNLFESYCYDALNRLTDSEVDGACGGNDNQQYDSFGNIVNKHDVGNGTDYQYGVNAGPHAVTTAGGINYYYDANGNLTSDSQGRTLDYTVFDKPYRITKGSDYSNEFWYGADRGRYLRFDSDGTSTQKTTYIGNVEFIERDGEFTVKRNVAGQVVVVEDRNADGSVNGRKFNYLLKDHLGSVDLILGSSLTPSTLGQAMSFDPWGQRRAPASLDNLYLNFSVMDLFEEGGLNEVTTRGFTGHEMLDGTGFIHMNGRVFDPVLARFVSADPLIQAPTNTQSYNRYSYTFNNPMKYTDPSGYSSWTDIRDFFTGRTFMRAIADNPLMNSLVQAGGCFATQIFCPLFLAAYSSSQTYHLTGDMGLAVKNGAIAGLSAWASQGIGNSTALGFEQKVLMSGLVGGLTSVANGGKFGTGFMTAGLSMALAPGIQGVTSNNMAAGMLVGAFVGGTISEATGGKFANGAATGAFAQALGSTRSGRKPTAQEVTYARLAKGVKDVGYQGVDGYVKVAPTYSDLDTGLRTALFVNQETGHYVQAFAGTNDGVDWSTNVPQAVGGEGAQYTQAIRIARTAYANYGGNIHFVGHSLGGGLAATAAIMTGAGATTFNAAGVHSNTVGGRTSVPGSITQFNSSFDAMQAGNALTPAWARGTQVSLGAAGVHGMAGVCRAMGC